MNAKPLTLSQTIAWGTFGVAIFLGLWTFLSATGIVPRQFLPSPFDVATRFFTLLTQPFAGATLPQHLASSFQRYAYGVILAAIIGIPLGLMMGWFRLLDDIVTPIFDGLRFIAPIAWVPFAALWFGTGIGGPVMIIFAGAFPPCLINAYRGARFVEPRLIEAARMLGTSNTRTILEVLLPTSVPSIISGLRVSAGLGWQSLVGAELIVAAAGVGFMMVQAQGNVQTA
ncbi:MAG: ABC transporter permease, partial [Beijerinckiaceae bacterium]